MNTVQDIVARCKGMVSLEINPHRNQYVAVARWLEHTEDISEHEPDTDEIRAKMEELDIVVDLQFYSLTPIGFHRILHHDVQTAIDEAIKVLE